MQDTKPEVSVVMSVYNSAQYLKTSIESILGQQGADFEFIIINDGSTDESGKILEKYAADDKRIQLFHQENQGLTKSLIRACNEARGKYIAYQDSDDISTPDRLLALSKFLNQNPAVILAFSWMRALTPEGTSLEKFTTNSSIEEVTKRLREKMVGVPGPGIMFKREIYNKVGGYREEFYYAQDCDLCLRLATEGKVGCVKQQLYDFVRRPLSISSHSRGLQKQFAELAQASYQARQQGKSENKFLESAQKLRERAIQAKSKKISRRTKATTYFLIASTLAEQKNCDALKYYEKALKTWPLYLRAWKGLLYHYLSTTKVRNSF